MYKGYPVALWIKYNLQRRYLDTDSLGLGIQGEHEFIQPIPAYCNLSRFSQEMQVGVPASASSILSWKTALSTCLDSDPCC